MITSEATLRHSLCHTPNSHTYTHIRITCTYTRTHTYMHIHTCVYARDILSTQAHHKDTPHTRTHTHRNNDTHTHHTDTHMHTYTICIVLSISMNFCSINECLSLFYSLTLLFVFSQLHKYAQATLGSGNLRLAVTLPEGEDLNEWIAVNTVDFFNQINMLYGTITEFCTLSTCPVMCAGQKYESI